MQNSLLGRILQDILKQLIGAQQHHFSNTETQMFEYASQQLEKPAAPVLTIL